MLFLSLLPPLSSAMSSFGHSFRVSTFGESHCAGVGCIVDGVPPRMALSADDIQTQLSRRRPGQSALTTARDEKDRVAILSGVEGGYTLGTPIALLVRNEDQRPGDYSSMGDVPRPSHADFTYQTKYGIRASSGGGRASARETIGRVTNNPSTHRSTCPASPPTLSACTLPCRPLVSSPCCCVVSCAALLFLCCLCEVAAGAIAEKCTPDKQHTPTRAR